MERDESPDFNYDDYVGLDYVSRSSWDPLDGSSSFRTLYRFWKQGEKIGAQVSLGAGLFWTGSASPGKLAHRTQVDPRDASELSSMFKSRVVFIVSRFNILPEFCYNMDEMSMELFPSMKRTWSQTGGKEVKIRGADDKRCFTLSSIVDARGHLVGNVQCIWAGKTEACEPPRG